MTFIIKKMKTSKKEFKDFMIKSYKLKQHSNCEELYTNEGATIQLEEQEKALLIRFKEQGDEED